MSGQRLFSSGQGGRSEQGDRRVAERARMFLLIDENVPESVADVFRQHGHEVRYTRDELAAGAPDPLIAASGDAVGAIVVTWNRKHFKKLATRASKRFPRLGLITFTCSEVDGAKRLETVIRVVEEEFERSLEREDSRLMLDIGKTKVSIDL